MFDIGFSEILLIFGLTLVVLGPDKLPHVARTIGRWAGRARAMARQFRDQLEAETDNLKVDVNLSPPAAAPPPASTPAPAPTPAATATPETPPATPTPSAPPTAPTPAPASPPTPDSAPHDRGE
jgi:Tat protein translocase TatB subunit